MGKGRLTHNALCHHTAGQGDFLILQFLKLLTDLLGVVRHLKLGDPEGIAAGILQGLQLIAAHLQNLAELRLGRCILRIVTNFFCHIATFVSADAETSFLWCQLSLERPTARIFTLYSPKGATTVTSSPTLAPSMALPRGL